MKRKAKKVRARTRKALKIRKSNFFKGIAAYIKSLV